MWLPSGGSLVIDRTEAMTVVDVNTGKFTGQGGNLEETVTRNNLEAAEEIVRQLRLRDIGGIIVIDFIDMVLESNRDLVLRRLVECLGRDRTKHQVAEVTSLGLVQMTRKRIGQGLLEVFSTPCEHCGGRGHIVHTEPVGFDAHPAEDAGNGRRDRNNRRPASRRRRRSRARREADRQDPAAAEVRRARPHRAQRCSRTTITDAERRAGRRGEEQHSELQSSEPQAHERARDLRAPRRARDLRARGPSEDQSELPSPRPHDEHGTSEPEAHEEHPILRARAPRRAPGPPSREPHDEQAILRARAAGADEHPTSEPDGPHGPDRAFEEPEAAVG